MRIQVYARVSTEEQELDIQREALRKVALGNGWLITHERVDKGISGSKGRDKRPGFAALCQSIEAGEVDMVMTWAVDRVSRNLMHFLRFVELCEKHKVKLYFHQQPNLNSDDPMGKALMQLMGVFAELERSFISARVKESYAYRRAQGKTFGPGIKVMEHQRETVRQMRLKGLTCRKIAVELGLGLGTVGRICKSERK